MLLTSINGVGQHGSGLDLKGKLTTMMQDVLRGPVLESLPFYDPKAVIALLDRMPELEERKRSGISYILTSILSTCILHATDTRAPAFSDRH